jgi:hypothetical protein
MDYRGSYHHAIEVLLGVEVHAPNWEDHEIVHWISSALISERKVATLALPRASDFSWLSMDRILLRL